jgi:hypothetical protein
VTAATAYLLRALHAEQAERLGVAAWTAPGRRVARAPHSRHRYQADLWQNCGISCAQPLVARAGIGEEIPSHARCSPLVSQRLDRRSPQAVMLAPSGRRWPY